jgi:glycosyltransferase involved in cell wall biosynthesis
MIVGLFPDLLSVGGIQTAGRHTAAVLARIAAERSWEARFLSLNDPVGRHETAAAGIQFEFDGFDRAKLHFTLEALKLARRDAHLVVATHPNLAVPAAGMRVKARGLPLIVMSHGVEVWKPLSRLRQAGLRAADCVLAPSRYTAARLHDVQQIPTEHIRVLHWALDPAFRNLASAADNLPLPDSIPRSRYVLAVGRWASAERYKGFDTLIRTLPQLRRAVPDLHLVFVGEGDDQPALEDLARSLDVREGVRFVSGLTGAQLVAAYRHAEIFALPSGGEGFGFVFLEAMALGKPTVGGNHGGIPDIIQDGVTGFLVPHGDAARLAERLTLLLSEPPLATEMGRRGRERVLQHFRFEDFEAGFREILVQICPATRAH